MPHLKIQISAIKTQFKGSKSSRHYLFDFLVEDVLDDFAETLELGFELLATLLLVLIFGKLQSFLRD